MRHTLPLLLLLPTLAQAQTPSSGVIPYSGTLFSQGKPVSQSVPVQMAFALYTDKEGFDPSVPSAAPAANRVWTSWVSTEGEDATVTPGSHSDNVIDDTISVAVRNGRFLVHLGEALANDIENTQIEIPDSKFDNDTLYVVTWVAQEVDGGGYNVFRLPPQKLETVPHAVTAKRATSFEVTDGLTVNLIQSQNNLLRIEGDVVINGNYRSTPETTCHEGYEKVGSLCFSSQTQGPESWKNARAACAQQGGDVCSIDELMYCDAVEPDGKHCTGVTSSTTLLWTRSIMAGEGTPDPFITSVFGNVACYNGTNEDSSNDLNLCAGTIGLVRNYLCCHHAR